MKISTVQQICKGAKRIELLSDPSQITQWISDGGAFYPLYDLPEFDQESMFALFDIPEKKRDKITFAYKYAFPETICFKDRMEGENALDFGTISICKSGRVLRPLKTSLGVIYINEKYLKPFSDSENGVQLYERCTSGGRVYVAVKEGVVLKGIIFPYDVVTKEFVSELKMICELSEIAVENKETGAIDESAENDVQMDLDEYLN